MTSEAVPLERLRYVSARYDQLQGLRFVPIGFVLVVFSVGLMVGFGVWMQVLLGASVVAALVGVPLAGRMYRARFGEARPRGRERPAVALTVGAVVGLSVSWLSNLELPISLPGLAVGALTAAYAWRWRQFMRAHLVVAALLVLGSVLPLGQLTGDAVHPLSDQVLALVIGVWLIVAGLLDHRLLVRTLGR